MKRSASARRVPRKIGQDEDDDVSAPSSADQKDNVVRRAPTRSRKSSSRTSLGLSSFDDEDAEASVVTPKRSNLSRIAIQRNASKRSSLNLASLPMRSADSFDGDRPSYDDSSLRQLKEGTPTTPSEFTSAQSSGIESTQQSLQTLDLSSKFGSSLARYHQSAAIPSATEIAEKKARRARLAKELQAEEFISLDPDDPGFDEDGDENVMIHENGRLVLKPKDKYGFSESRLVRDDEDILEGFDEFTEDGQIALGKRAKAEAARKRKQEMASQIAEAEGVTDSDESDESEHERNAAFEAAQTRHGTYSLNASISDTTYTMPKAPPLITPLPTLDGSITRLRNRLAEMQSSRMQKLQEVESLHREGIRLAEEEVRIQSALNETAEKFEQLRRDKGIGGVTSKENTLTVLPSPSGPNVTNDRQTLDMDGDGNKLEDEAEDKAEDEENGVFGLGVGLGFASTRNNDGDSLV